MVHKTLGFPEPRSRLCQMLDMSMANQKIQGFMGESKSAGFWHKPSRGVVTFIWRWCVDPSSNSKPIENLGFLKAFLGRLSKVEQTHLARNLQDWGNFACARKEEGCQNGHGTKMARSCAAARKA